MKTTHLVIAVIIVGLVLCSPVQCLAAMASIRGIGFATDVEGISADGSVIVGMYGSPAHGFYWSDATGMVEIPGLDSCEAVSADGSVIVGDDLGQACYWTEATGIVRLGLVSGSSGFSGAVDISSDGSVIVGYSTSLEYFTETFVWTEETGMVGLGDLPGGVDSSSAYAVSSDGLVIAGGGKSDIGNEAFRWTEETGMVGLGVVEGRSSSTAWGISADGSTVVGQSSYEAFRWTEETGMVGLGTLGHGEPWMENQTLAVDASADGSTVIGNSWVVGAFIWDEPHGIRELDSALVDDYGLDLAGWDLGWVHGISDDGLTMAGEGVNPDGANETWIVTVPEPATFIFLGVAYLLLCRNERR